MISLEIKQRCELKELAWKILQLLTTILQKMIYSGYIGKKVVYNIPLFTTLSNIGRCVKWREITFVGRLLSARPQTRSFINVTSFNSPWNPWVYLHFRWMNWHLEFKSKSVWSHRPALFSVLLDTNSRLKVFISDNVSNYATFSAHHYPYPTSCVVKWGPLN